MFKSRDIKELDFAKYGAQIVLECTGAHLTIEKCQGFLDMGVQKVIMSAPAKDDTPTYVLGVIHKIIKVKISSLMQVVRLTA